MTYAELSEAQARRSRQFAEAQTDAMSVYCDAERDLKELQAENAKLRDRVQGLQAENAKLRGARDVWQENDVKLRELVRDIYESAYYEYPSYFESKFAGRMRALGIEVDG